MPSDEKNPFSSQLIAVPLDSFHPHAPATCQIYVKIQGKPVLFRSAGQFIGPDRLSRMREIGVGCLWVPVESWAEFKSYAEAIFVGESLTPKQQFLKDRFLATVAGCEIEWNLCKDISKIYKLYQGIAHRLADVIHHEKYRVGEWLTVSPSSETYYVRHPFDVAVYALVISLQAKFNRIQLEELALSALLHDIGHFDLVKHADFSSQRWGEEQIEELKHHTSAGMRILQSLGAPNYVLRVAGEHHARADGEGFPSGLSGDSLHIYSKICDLAEAFDELTGWNPGGEHFALDDAITELSLQEGRFDEEWLSWAIAALEQLVKYKHLDEKKHKAA